MNLNFTKYSDGLVPCIIQDVNTNAVLMLGYMNEAAYTKTVETKIVTFFSRSKNRLWTKGETSNHFLTMVSIYLDCDKDAILIKAIPNGPTCHRNTYSCFDDITDNFTLEKLETIIADRKQNNSNSSYTSSLFEKGINKIAQKLGEEAVELVIESKDNNEKLFLGEAADLLFHYLVLLQAKSFTLQDVVKVLEERHKV